MLEGSFKDVHEHGENGTSSARKSSGSTWIPHGYFRKINEFGEIEFFGCFINGKLRGKCWKGVIGGIPLFEIIIYYIDSFFIQIIVIKIVSPSS